MAWETGIINATANRLAMRYLLTATAAAALLAGPAMGQGNPYQLGMEYCGMVRNGISRKKAWDYIVSSYVRSSPSALNSGDPYAPWSPMNSLGGAIGSGIAAGMRAGMELRAMKSDLQAVISANCPEGTAVSVAMPSDTKGIEAKDLWCIHWAENCTESGAKNNSKSDTSCDKTLQKFECSYKKYLVANPAVEKWAKANPAMAKKEAIRLGAVDAEEIALPGVKEDRSKIATPPITKDIENKCLKAADYKGCMEYNLKK